MITAIYLFGSGVSSGWHSVIADVLNCKVVNIYQMFLQLNYLTIFFNYITKTRANYELECKRKRHDKFSRTIIRKQ